MKKFIKEWGGSILLCLSIIFIKVAVVDVAEVSGVSMNPTLQDRDKLIIEKVTRYGNIYNRGDIVILESHRENKETGVGKYWIKRIMALPGDTIECKNNKLYINDEEFTESYIPETTFTEDISRTEVPEGKMYVLGDNRTNSGDSRDIGFVDYKDIYGKYIYNLNR